ncbi:MAG: GNAT family N-acetyltransferase [Chitinophagaceae bacterium]
MFSSLDNPIWQALNSRDSHMATGNTYFKMYPADIAAFVGINEAEPSALEHLLAALSGQSIKVTIIKNALSFSGAWNILKSATVVQMVTQNPVPVLGNEEIVPLQVEHIAQMLALTNLTQPGPFLDRTIEFGNYLGIFHSGKLVAMGGERLHLDRFSEISAICTHPDYQGRGFGSRLTAQLAQNILQQGRTPFLHARANNHPAISLYKKLGFYIRTEMNLHIFQKP